MTDQQLLELYFARSEQAITETEKQYGSLCYTISYNILYNREDAEECVNDTYLSAWNHIPPTRPTIFSVYLSRITRNLSIDRWRKSHAGKRGKGQVTAAVEELEYCLTKGDDPEKAYLQKELTEVLNEFLGTLTQVERKVFVSRYWYLDSVGDISNNYGFSIPKVKNMLMRTRRKLKKHLEQKGVYGS